MKKLGYLFFAFFFQIGRIFPIKRTKIVLFNGHNHGLNGNLLEIKRAIEGRSKKRNIQQGLEKRAEQVVGRRAEKEDEYQFIFRAKRDMFGDGSFSGKIKGAVDFFVVLPFHMATAGKIFLNDNFLPLGYCHPSKRTQIIQLWHGAGAFKKFGLSTEENKAVERQVIRANSRITHLFITSKQVLPFYQEAFGVPCDRIFVTGIPVTDVYFKEEKRKQARERFYGQYPQLMGKKILLYTPTFRKTEKENIGIMEQFDVSQIKKILGDSWVILIKMHPKYPVSNIPENSFCYNMTNYSQITDLYFVSDMLITDYSSTIVEYVLLDKPVILYAYDGQEYDRGFYRSYEATVPGPVAHNQEELFALLLDDQKESQKRQNFAKLQYDYRDSKSSERILSILEMTD